MPPNPTVYRAAAVASDCGTIAPEPRQPVNLLLGGRRPSVKEYDEDAELTRYVWDHYAGLMTDFERRVGSAIIGRMKAAASSNPTVTRMLNEHWGKAGDAAVDAALAEGSETFRRRVCQRVLIECKGKVFVNLCPRCKRVVRTPQARQCFWCGEDWHQPAAESGGATDTGRDND